MAADECSRKFNSCLLPTCVEVLSALPLSEQIIILHSEATTSNKSRRSLVIPLRSTFRNVNNDQSM